MAIYQAQQLTKCESVNGRCTFVYPEYTPPASITFKHTNFYVNNWKKDRSNRGLFFDDRTYGYKTRFALTIVKTRATFLQKIAVKCTGRYCTNGEFSCKNNPDCYHVEHIIDMNGPEFGRGNACKDIVANKVMAYSRWNQALGGKTKGGLNGYATVAIEKEEVYGKDVMRIVRSKIRECIENTITVASPVILTPPTIFHNKRDYIQDDYCEVDEDCGCDPDSTCDCECPEDYVDEVSEILVLTELKDYYKNVVIFLSIFSVIVLILFVVGVVVVFREKNKLDVQPDFGTDSLDSCEDS